MEKAIWHAAPDYPSAMDFSENNSSYTTPRPDSESMALAKLPENRALDLYRPYNIISLVINT